MTTHSFKMSALEVYYEYCYPVQLLWKWLSNMDGAEDLVLHADYKEVLQIADESQTTREIAFSFKEGGYKRPLFYKSFRLFRQDILQMKPTSIHIGATYRSIIPPLIADGVKLRELVFDVDMDDYKLVIDRTKCECKSSESKSVCKVCWIVMKAGMRVLYNILNKDFGFNHIYFFYSGRRGFHCWVTDHRAKMLSRVARQSILNNMYRPCIPHEHAQFRVHKTERVISTYSHSKRRDIFNSLCLWKINPSLERDYTCLLSTFKELCYKFEMCKGKEGYTHMIELFLNDASDRFAMRYKEKNDKPKLSRHGCFFHVVIATVYEYMRPFVTPCEVSDSSYASNWRRVPPRRPLFPKYSIITLLPRIVFYYLGPRIDEGVTLGMTHLTKSPFSVHKDTRQICVPVSHTIPQFDPSSVPTIDQLLEDYTNIPMKEKDVVEKIWKQTRLCTFIQQFASDINANTQVDMHAI